MKIEEFTVVKAFIVVAVGLMVAVIMIFVALTDASWETKGQIGDSFNIITCISTFLGVTAGSLALYYQQRQLLAAQAQIEAAARDNRLSVQAQMIETVSGILHEKELLDAVYYLQDEAPVAKESIELREKNLPKIEIERGKQPVSLDAALKFAAALDEDKQMYERQYNDSCSYVCGYYDAVATMGEAGYVDLHVLAKMWRAAILRRWELVVEYVMEKRRNGEDGFAIRFEHWKKIAAEYKAPASFNPTPLREW